MFRSNKLQAIVAQAFILGAMLCVLQTAAAQTCAPPPAGLVDFWPGDRSSNDFIGLNHGTLTNGATFRDSGRVGPAFILDGTDDYVATPSINIGSNFTIELWINPTTAAGYEELIGNNQSSGNFGVLYFVNDHLEYWQSGGIKAFTPGNSVPLNTWTHVALVYDGGAQRVQLYLNGAASGSPSVTHTELFNNSLRFGDAVINASNNFNGALDEISLFNTALSAAAVLSIFNAGDKGKCAAPALLVNEASVLEGDGGTTNLSFTVNLLRATTAAGISYATADGTATQPVDYFATSGTTTVPASGSATVTVLVNGDTALEPNETFLLNLSNPVNAVIADGQSIGTIFSDDCSAPRSGIADWYKAESNALDSIGTNHGTLENGASFVTGNTGQAFSLDGVDDFVDVAANVNLGSAYTIELWIYPTGASTQNLVSNNQSGANFGNLYFNGGSNRLEYVQANGLKTNSVGTIPLNAWTHVALTYDGAVNRLYVDGSASGTASGIHAETFNNPLRLGFSVDSSGNKFKGQLDEVSLYSRALSPAEIQAIFLAGGGGKCSGALANTWTGAVSSDWHTAGNWASGAVPPNASDVAIPAAGVTNEPTITSADVTVNSLSVNANRTLTVAGGRTLTVTNDLINNAALAGPGTVVELGAVNNSGTISVGGFNFNRVGSQTLIGSGSFSNNVATVANGATLTLLSDHQFSSLVVQAGATLDISLRTLSVSGDLANNGAITITNSTVAANGTTPQILTNANYRNLTANNSTGVSLGSDASVSHLLTLNSDLLTGVFVLTMPWSTETTAGAADVVGNIRVTGLNSSPASYGNPFNTIAFNSGTPPADITVNLVKTIPSGFPTAVQRTYNITPNGGAGFTATVRLHYLDSELNGNAEGAALSLWRFNGSSWEKKTTSAFSTTNNWVETGNVTQFSPWAFNSNAPTAATATISGQITNADGTPVGGVLLSLSGGNVSRHTITNKGGFFEFTELDTGAFYSVRPMRANYSFAPSERSFSLPGNKTDAVFTAHAEPVTANPLDTPEFFVRQQYLDFLSREPDPDGFKYWVDAISQCGLEASCQRARRIDVSNAFFYEREFQESAAYVYRIYKATLGQRPTFAQFQPDRELLVGGIGLDQRKAAFALVFAQRDNFLLTYPRSQTGHQFVDALLNTIKGSSGVDLAFRRAELLALFDGTDNGRAAILHQLADDESFIDSEYNRSFVLSQYFGYLGRDPDQDGFDFWLGQVNSAPLRDTTKQHAMVCSFVSSPEYQLRFSSVVTHSNAECH